MGGWFSESLRVLVALIESTLGFVRSLLAQDWREGSSRLCERAARHRVEQQLRSSSQVVRLIDELGRGLARGSGRKPRREERALGEAPSHSTATKDRADDERGDEQWQR